MITLGIIVKDGARLLPRVFMSVMGVADEIVVVDTGSTDATVDVAREFGARVVHHRWSDDFSEARNVYLAHARTPWILVLDADEALDAEAPGVIRQAIEAMDDGGLPTLFYMPVKSYTSDDENDGHAMETWLPRLIPRVAGLRYEGAVHENPVLVDGSPFRTAMIPAAIRHYGYKLTGEERIRKSLRNWELIKKAVTSDPENPFNHFNYGFAVFNESNYEAALLAFERSAELLGRTTRAAYYPYMLVLSAICLKNLGEPERALAHLEQALELHSDLADAYYVTGIIRLERRERSAAAAAFHEALACADMPRTYYGLRDLSAANWKPLLELAQLSFADGKFREALAFYERALDYLPWNKHVLADIGLCLARLGERERALASWNVAFPEGFASEETAVEFVEALAAAKDGVHAHKVYEELARKFPAGYGLHMAAARALVAVGMKGNARTAFERALAARPGDAAATAHLAALLMELGLAHEAVKLLGG